MRNTIYTCLLAIAAATFIAGCGGGGTRGNPVAPLPVAGTAFTISGTAKIPNSVSASRVAEQGTSLSGLKNLPSGTAAAYYLDSSGNPSGAALAASEVSDGAFSFTLPATITFLPPELAVVVTSGGISMRAFIGSTDNVQVNPVSDYIVNKIAASGQDFEYFSTDEFGAIYSQVESSVISQNISFSSYTSVSAAVSALNLNTTITTVVGQQISAATVPEVTATVSPESGTASDVYTLTCTVSGGSYSMMQGRCDDADSWLTLSGGILACTYSSSGIFTPQCRVDSHDSTASETTVNVGLPTDSIIITGKVYALYMVLAGRVAGRVAGAATDTTGISAAANYSVALYSDYGSSKTSVASDTTDINGDFILVLPKSVTSLDGSYVVEASQGNDTIRSFVVTTTDLVVSPQSDYIVMEAQDSGYALNSFTTSELAWIDAAVEDLFVEYDIDYSQYQTTTQAVEDAESETGISTKTARLLEMSALPDGYGTDDSGLIPYVSNSGDDFGLYVMSSTGGGITKIKGGDSTIHYASIVGSQVVYESTSSSGAVTELRMAGADGSNDQRITTFVPNDDVTHPFGHYADGRLLYLKNNINAQSVEAIQIIQLDEGEVVRIWDNGSNYQDLSCPVRYDKDRLLAAIRVCTGSVALCDFEYGLARIDMESGAMTVIVDDMEVASCPAVSSNGKIIFSSRGGNPEISTPYQLYSVDINGNNLTQLTYDLGSSRYPYPLPGGKIAYEYWNTAVRNCDIYTITDTGASKTNITNTATSDEVLYGYNLKFNKSEAGDDVGHCYQPPPRPIIDASPTYGIAPLTVYFEGSVVSGTPESYSWDFGDETSSDAKNPVHTYITNATYTVTLTVTDLYGGTDSVTEDIVVSMGVTWKRTYSFKIYDVVETSCNGFVMVGSYDTPDSVLLKLDPRGTTVWQRNLSRVYAYSLVQTSDDGFLVVGLDSSTSAPILMRFDCDGIKLWEQTFTQFSAPAQKIIAKGDGNYLIGGAGSSGTGFLMETDATGNVSWSTSVSTPCGRMAFHPVASGGAVYVQDNSCVEGSPSSFFILDNTGFTLSSYAVGNVVPGGVLQSPDGAFVLSGTGGTCSSSEFDECTTAWFYKIDSSGTLLWEEEYDSDGGEIETSGYIDTLQNGGYISVGSRDSDPSAGNIAIYVSKLDNNGGLVWEKEYGDYPAFDSPVIHETNEDGGFIITGMTGTGTLLESVIVKLNVNGECEDCF